MDHSMMSGMDMGSMSMTATGTGMAMPTSTGEAMAGMDGMGMGNGCKISMLWNWNTVDSCFISESWHVTSKGMFAGSCIGVVLLVIMLELLRRAGKEYDRYIVAQYKRSMHVGPAPVPSATPSTQDGDNGATKGLVTSTAARGVAAGAPFRPNVLQQAIRALLHMLQFAVAYFVMLLAMYYNGYFIICIFIGAYIGYFVFGWETLMASNNRMEENVTVCCG